MVDYSLDSEFTRELDRDILEFIHRGIDHDDERGFNDLALREFEYQYHVNDLYRDYCDRAGVNPNTITRWDEAPVVPSEAFKDHIIASFPLEQIELSYMTGGTTSPRRGKIYRDKRAVDLIYTANRLCAREFLFPDMDRMRILLMAPSPKVAPTMGMAVGLEQVRLGFGTEDSTYLITPLGLNVKTLLSSLEDAEKTGKPIALIGATSGFVHFFNVCHKEGLKFNLQEGSRIADGGGYSGVFGDCTQDDFHDLCEQVLGIPREYVVNTYGTGESSTNYFDNVLRNHLRGKPGGRVKTSPPWTRTVVVDTETFERLPRGEVGLLRHYDLANRAMVFGVQTDNLGYETEGGFEILGRAGVEDGEIKVTPVDRMVGPMAERRMGRVMDGVMRRLIDLQVPRQARAMSRKRNINKEDIKKNE